MPKAENENFAAIDGNLLRGDRCPVLELIKIQVPEGEKNNLRLSLSMCDPDTRAEFGGKVAFLIKPERCHHYFKTIETADQFFQLSERIHDTLVDFFKS